MKKIMSLLIVVLTLCMSIAGVNASSDVEVGFLDFEQTSPQIALGKYDSVDVHFTNVTDANYDLVTLNIDVYEVDGNPNGGNWRVIRNFSNMKDRHGTQWKSSFNKRARVYLKNGNLRYVKEPLTLHIRRYEDVIMCKIDNEDGKVYMKQQYKPLSNAPEYIYFDIFTAQCQLDNVSYHYYSTEKASDVKVTSIWMQLVYYIALLALLMLATGVASLLEASMLTAFFNIITGGIWFMALMQIVMKFIPALTTKLTLLLNDYAGCGWLVLNPSQPKYTFYFMLSIAIVVGIGLLTLCMSKSNFVLTLIAMLLFGAIHAIGLIIFGTHIHAIMNGNWFASLTLLSLGFVALKPLFK